MERDEPDAIFHPDGDGFVPTAFARGPWDPNAQHGGAPSALLARAIEAHESVPVMQVARLTTHPGRLGAGLAEAALYDEPGRIGRSVQSLLFDHP